MRVVFLDIDGVLVPGPSEDRPSNRDLARPEAVAALNRITRETDASIVVSSNWRIKFDLARLQQMLEGWGVEGVIGSRTPAIDPEPFNKNPAVPVDRGEEIEAWLEAHPRVESFVILDDDADMGRLRNRLVQTNERTGLTEADADRAITLLQEPLDNRRKSSPIIRADEDEMPWDPSDAARHTKKAQSATSQRQWSEVANSVLERGGSEGKAVRQANAVVARRKHKKSHRERAFTGR